MSNSFKLKPLVLKLPINLHTKFISFWIHIFLSSNISIYEKNKIFKLLSCILLFSMWLLKYLLISSYNFLESTKVILSFLFALRIKFPIEWNVKIGQGMFKFTFTLFLNSKTALLVKDITSISLGFIFFFSTKYFILAASVVVLPAPAPAITNE